MKAACHRPVGSAGRVTRRGSPSTALFLFALPMAVAGALFALWPLGDRAFGEAAGSLAPPEIPEGEMTVRRFTILRPDQSGDLPESRSGTLPGEVATTIHRTAHADGDFLDVRNEATLLNGNHHEVRMRIRLASPPRAVAYREVEWPKKKETDGNEDGRNGMLTPVREGFFRFDDPAYQYPADLYQVWMLPVVLRGMSFHKGEEGYIHVWAAPTVIVGIALEVEGEETIQVPAGEFACYRLTLTPDLKTIMPFATWLHPILKPFVPSYRFWFAKDLGHPLVKYEGVGGGPGAARQVGELTSIHHEGKWEPTFGLFPELSAPAPVPVGPPPPRPAGPG